MPVVEERGGRDRDPEHDTHPGWIQAWDRRECAAQQHEREEPRGEESCLSQRVDEKAGATAPATLGIGIEFHCAGDAELLSRGSALARAVLGRGIFEVELIHDQRVGDWVAIDLNPRAQGSERRVGQGWRPQPPGGSEVEGEAEGCAENPGSLRSYAGRPEHEHVEGVEVERHKQ